MITRTWAHDYRTEAGDYICAFRSHRLIRFLGGAWALFYKGIDDTVLVNELDTFYKGIDDIVLVDFDFQGD